MDKVYKPQDIEQKHYQTWEEKGFFKPEGDGPRFNIMIPPPNVTGALHMGHALNHTLQDVIVRQKRLTGHRVLWLPGTDHAGISTQNVVEKKLAKDGVSRKDLGRDKFLEEVWDWKEEYGSRIMEQVRRLGDSVDWSRERFTMDEGCAKAVRENFVNLFEDGLIYRGSYIINWCPRCETALSDIEVDHQDVNSHLWYFKYETRDKSKHIVIATTRPETVFGDVAIAVNPTDDRYKDLIGEEVQVPLTDRYIPIIADDYVDSSFGSGAVKITPAHDPNDFEVGQRHNLEQLLAFDERGILGTLAPEALQGLSRFDCRKAMIPLMEAAGNFVKKEDHNHAVGHCYRCRDVVEPYLSKQWFVAMDELAKPAIEAVKSDEINFVPKRWKALYFDWMENIRDWCISRQIWWGHRIPVWYCPDHPDEPIVSRDTPESCPICGNTHLRQDEDVLDTWFSSALWAFSTLGWPDKTKDLEDFYPNSFLVTGYDIITFWVSRMITISMYQLKETPFKDVYIHGLVRDISGKKMSKSIGNVINPLDLIETYGADALRFSLTSLSTLGGQDIRFSEEKVESARNFANKLWNASRFIMMHIDEHDGEIPQELAQFDQSFENQWILSHYAKTVTAINEAYASYNYAQVADLLWDFTWNVFCDWYLEMSKLNKESSLPVLTYVLKNILILLHPVMPFITEEIWQILRESNKVALSHDYLIKAQWPEIEASMVQAPLMEAMDLNIDLIRSVRNLRTERQIPPSKPVNLVLISKDAKATEALTQGQPFIQKLAKVADIQVSAQDSDKPAEALSSVVQTVELFIPLAGLINVDEERQRLAKKLADIEKELLGYEKKLGNAQFLAKAPEHVVNGIKEKAGIAQAEKDLLSVQLTQLSNA